MANLDKKNLVSSISRSLSTTSFVLAEIKEKSTHIALEKVRRELKPLSGKITYVKNSLLKKAFQQNYQKNSVLRAFLGNQANFKFSVSICYLGAEWDKTLKIVSKFVKEGNLITFKDGLIDGQYYQAKDIDRIAALPSKAELMAKIVGGMKSPMCSAVYALKYNIQRLVFILSEKSKQA